MNKVYHQKEHVSRGAAAWPAVSQLVLLRVNRAFPAVHKRPGRRNANGRSWPSCCMARRKELPPSQVGEGRAAHALGHLGDLPCEGASPGRQPRAQPRVCKAFKFDDPRGIGALQRRSGSATQTQRRWAGTTYHLASGFSARTVGSRSCAPSGLCSKKMRDSIRESTQISAQG